MGQEDSTGWIIGAFLLVSLLAGDFDFEVLTTAEWLSERYGVDIRCYRIALSADGETEFLTCTCIYPPPELTQHAIRRGRNGGSHPLKWADWDAALAPIENPAIVNFFSQELAAGRDSYLRKRILRYRLGGKRRLWIAARKKAAYVWQTGRFENDAQFWTTKLGVEANRTGAPLRRRTLSRSTCRNRERLQRPLTRPIHVQCRVVRFRTCPVIR